MQHAAFKWYLYMNSLIIQNGTKTTIVNEEGTPRDFTFDYSFWSHDSFKMRADGYNEPETSKYHD